MSRIFISYKRADKEKVFPIKDKIEAATGEKCWIDLEDINSDVNSWEDKIIHAINEASIFLFMYSTHVAEIKDEENDRTLDEFSFARSKNKRIVFINIDQTPLTDKYAFRFGQRQQVDAASEQAMNKLVEDIKIWLNICVVKDTPKNTLVASYTEGLEYYYDDNNYEAIVTGIGTATQTDIIIPSVVNERNKEYKVVGIGERAFYYCDHLVSVVIPKGVISIDDFAFSVCMNLRSIEIPQGVVNIGNSAFLRCYSLTSISLPDTIKDIGDYAFGKCTNLSSIEIPKGIQKIRNMLFRHCENLRIVKIPQSVKSIGISAFRGCNKLDTIVLPNGIEFIAPDAFPITCKIVKQ